MIVMGIGGIGINAVQGAAHAGASNIIAVDPVAFKREKAAGARAPRTPCESMEEATELAKQFTNGQGADSAIVTVGVTKPASTSAQAFGAIRKAGTVRRHRPRRHHRGRPADRRWPSSPCSRSGCRARCSAPPTRTGTSCASCELYRAGVLKLDELITKTYTLDEIAQGYQDMHDGKNIRGVIQYDD